MAAVKATGLYTKTGSYRVAILSEILDYISFILCTLEFEVLKTIKVVK